MQAVLNFIYDNILSIAMMVMLIAAGIFLSYKTGLLQFRRFGYMMKNTAGSLFDKNLHSMQFLCNEQQNLHGFHFSFLRQNLETQGNLC